MGAFVDPGICGWGGMALNAVAVDKRVKAVAVSTMYDMTRVMSRGYNDSMTPGQRTQTLEQLSRQRWEDVANGAPGYGPPMNELKGGEAQFLVDYHSYYKTPRGFHERSVNSNASWTITNPLSFMNMPILNYIKEISPRPILFVHGENAHSCYFSETAYAAAAEPKELVIVPGATTPICTTGSMSSRSTGSRPSSSGTLLRKLLRPVEGGDDHAQGVFSESVGVARAGDGLGRPDRLGLAELVDLHDPWRDRAARYLPDHACAAR